MFKGPFKCWLMVFGLMCCKERLSGLSSEVECEVRHVALLVREFKSKALTLSAISCTVCTVRGLEKVIDVYFTCVCNISVYHVLYSII